MAEPMVGLKAFWTAEPMVVQLALLSACLKAMVI